ncbi:porin family protein [Sanyastnella coralliicola]|uniref:porin family protein n=1 Tax=Sanyastnella coralliicola TaxID=3069118 RepID=UPI0027B8E076|nr:porin family protein [Longitalea sp. SCSIO 12813]
MKKTLSVLIAIMAFTQLSTAQEDFTKFRMGFKVSPNISWFQPQDKHFTSEGSVLRFGFGFNADVFFAQNYAIGTGVNVMRNGGKISYLEVTNSQGTDYIVRRERSMSNQYVEVPLTFKLRTNEIGYITYWGQFGFGLGVNINARGDNEDELMYFYDESDPMDPGWKAVADRVVQLEEDVNFSDDVQLFRMSMIIGGGIEYNLSGSTSILVGVTYNNGFTNAFKDTDVIRTENGEPVFESGQPRDDVRLRAISNSIELNLGILF